MPSHSPIALLFALLLLTPIAGRAQTHQTYWSIWKPSEKRAVDLVSDGYEMKSVSSTRTAEFAYLQKGASVFRCVVDQLDPHMTQLSTPTFWCVELTKPYQRE